jgi:alcohol dehydrogenase
MPTFQAMQVIRPGVLARVELAVPAPQPGEVLLRVEACGICGADAATIEGTQPGLQLPRIPGHEVIGRIVAVGPGVSPRFPIGMRVGVGRLGGPCLACDQCRQGQFVLCQDQPVIGATHDGGYAEMMIARATGLVAVPDALTAEEAAPPLCAGIATFNAFRKSGALAGDLVAVQGMGGLGHLAVQYARKMGFRTVAIGRGDNIADDIRRLGAHLYIDARAEDAAARLKAMGGAQIIMSTITDSAAVSALLSGLAPHGKLLVVGVGREPLTIAPGALVGGERVIQGMITGSTFESERTLDFSVLADVRPMIETMPMERAFEAYQRMVTGDAKFRMVLTMPG